MSSKADRDYIFNTLVPELKDKFDVWAKEYEHQPRDLGFRGEFVGLYRKVRKIKSVVWDAVDASGWREGLRIMLFEVVAHGLLMLRDYDAEAQPVQSVSPAAPANVSMAHKFKAGLSGVTCVYMVQRNGGGDACGATASHPIHIDESADSNDR